MSLSYIIRIECLYIACYASLPIQQFVSIALIDLSHWSTAYTALDRLLVLFTLTTA